MPPARTIPPAKAIKTERTHEENQERAYIAASRRSDRSLEARVESARRASEIHKRRTGRSLRVTEQDVINEEMYEEEDDDLPLQYRRLTAHLQTGSADFNRRLAAYLTGQVAMRSAFDQVMHPYPQPNGMYPPVNPNAFQSPLLPNGMTHSPTTYRAAPYPSPHQPGFRQAHGRAYSTIAVPSYNPVSPAEATPHSLDHRRMSTPATVPSAMNTPRGIDTNAAKPDAEYLRQTQSATFPSTTYSNYGTDMAPFTTTLSPEAQQMLGPAMDTTDHFQSMLMQGSENYIHSPYYPWAAYQNGIKGMPVHPAAYAGMSATLAPAALDASSEAVSTAGTPSTTTAGKGEMTVPSAGLDFNFSQESKMLPLHSVGGAEPLGRQSSNQGLASGHATPADEGFWGNFVDDASWNEETAAS